MLNQGRAISLPQKWTVRVPTSVVLVGKRTDDRKIYLNLNWYRNENFHTLNKVKVTFAELVSKDIQHLPKFEAVHLVYEVFAGTSREFDVANVGSIVDKFFSDALVSADKLEDDNYNVVLSASYRFGGIRKGDPHCLVHIQPVLSIPISTGENMQIILVQHEIETALRNHVTSLLQVREGNRIDITLKATRGEEGSTALIDIVPDNTVAVGQAVISSAVTAVQTAARPVVRGLSPQRSSTAAISPEPEAVTEAAGQASSGDAQADTAIATGDVAQGEVDQAATGTDSAQGSARPTGLFAHLKKPAATAQVSEG